MNKKNRFSSAWQAVLTCQVCGGAVADTCKKADLKSQVHVWSSERRLLFSKNQKLQRKASAELTARSKAASLEWLDGSLQVNILWSLIWTDFNRKATQQRWEKKPIENHFFSVKRPSICNRKSLIRLNMVLLPWIPSNPLQANQLKITEDPSEKSVNATPLSVSSVVVE